MRRNIRVKVGKEYGYIFAIEGSSIVVEFSDTDRRSFPSSKVKLAYPKSKFYSARFALL